MKNLLGSLILSLLLAAPAWALVDVNTATRSELESLKGIGPTKAQAIIDYRQKHGPFKRLEDLEKVKGIGKTTVDKLKGELTVHGEWPPLPMKDVVDGHERSLSPSPSPRGGGERRESLSRLSR